MVICKLVRKSGDMIFMMISFIIRNRAKEEYGIRRIVAANCQNAQWYIYVGML